MINNSQGDRLYERFQLIVNGPALFNAVVAGLDLGVFAFLSSHPNSTFNELQVDAGIGAHKLRVLMLALCATELVEKHDARFSNSSVAEQFLASDGPDSWRHILAGWQRIYYPAFAETTSALRTGTNVALDAYQGEGATLYERLTANPALEKILHQSMSAFTLQSMDGLLQHADFGSIGRLLDVGGGDGTTARLIAERFPHLAVTLFDMPSVTAIGADSRHSGPGGRITERPGDFLVEEFPGGHDAVLFSHVLEVFGEGEILRLLSKAFRALPEGGKIFIYGFNATDDERGGVLGARLSLYLNVLASGKGMAYPAKDYERWLQAVGFTGVSTVGALPYEHGLTLGTKI